MCPWGLNSYGVAWHHSPALQSAAGADICLPSGKCSATDPSSLGKIRYANAQGFLFTAKYRQASGVRNRVQSSQLLLKASIPF